MVVSCQIMVLRGILTDIQQIDTVQYLRTSVFKHALRVDFKIGCV